MQEDKSVLCAGAGGGILIQLGVDGSELPKLLFAGGRNIDVLHPQTLGLRFVVILTIFFYQYLLG